MGTKISALPAIPSCQLTDLIPEVQPASGGTTYKATIQQLLNLFIASGFNTLPYTVVTLTTQSMLANNGYITNNAALVTLTLPTTAAVGTRLEVIGLGAGGWTVAQNAGQSIQVGTITSTVGVGGSVSSSNASDSFQIICIVADTQWAILSGAQSGLLTIV